VAALIGGCGSHWAKQRRHQRNGLWMFFRGVAGGMPTIVVAG
jgi:hypothetical protein